MSEQVAPQKLTPTELLTLWYFRVLRALQNHREAVDNLRLMESRLTKINAFAGIAVLALSGVSITLQETDELLGFSIKSGYISIALTFASATVLITSMWQLLAQYGTLSVRVEWTAVAYSAVVREIEQALATDVNIEQLHRFREALDHLACRGQLIPPKMWSSNLAPLNVEELIRELQTRLTRH